MEGNTILRNWHTCTGIYEQERVEVERNEPIKIQAILKEAWNEDLYGVANLNFDTNNVNGFARNDIPANLVADLGPNQTVTVVYILKPKNLGNQCIV